MEVKKDLRLGSKSKYKWAVVWNDGSKSYYKTKKLAISAMRRDLAKNPRKRSKKISKNMKGTLGELLGMKRQKDKMAKKRKSYKSHLDDLDVLLGSAEPGSERIGGESLSDDEFADLEKRYKKRKQKKKLKQLYDLV